MEEEVDKEMDMEMDMEVVYMEVDKEMDEEMDMEVKIQRNLGNTRSVRSARAQSGWWWVRWARADLMR